MNLVSVRIISPNIKALVEFYEQVTKLPATWYTEDFAEIKSAVSTLAIGSTRTLNLFGIASTHKQNNNNLIIEFLVNNVDAHYQEIKNLLDEIIQEPTTMPWGNRSLLFRDPDGNLINFFSPVTPEAIKKFSSLPSASK